MKRSVVACVMALGLVLVPTVAAQTPTQDSVNGSGHALTSDSQGVDFIITASSGPSGENPTGQVAFTQGRFGTNFAGPVTCLAVNGNVANLNVSSGLGVVTLEVTDSPSGDLIRAALAGHAPADCSVLGEAVDFRVVTGDIVVVDAPALPTFKDQCKNGGWKTYGVFTNQGDCIGFVATKGKNPPANSP